VCEILGESTLETSGEVAKRRGWVNITIGDFTAAIEDFNRMLATARRLGNRHLEGMALAYRGRAEHHNHEGETSVETLKAALAVAEEGFEDVRFFVSITLGAHFLIYNRHIEAKPLLLEAEKLASEVDDPFILGWWSVVGSLWLYWEGRFDEALRFQARWHGAIRRGGVTFLMNSWVEALARIGKGEYERALALLQDMLDTAERMGDIFWRARALNTIGWLNGELQDHRQAMEWNMQGVEVALEAAIRNLEVEINARLNLGDNLLALDRLDVAEEHFQKVEEEVQNPRPQDLWMLWRYSQHLFHSYGELWLARGNLDKAMQYADECLALAEQSNSQRNVVKSHRLRAQVFLAQSKLPEAEKELSIALRVAQQVGNPTQLWKTYAVLGDLLQAQGRPDDARQAYSDAVSVIEEVAAGLKDKLLRDTFMNSHLVQEIRHKAQGESLIT
jgi:tetratricopeptide (TPR) repeat protein